MADIVKADGSIETFEPTRLRVSLIRAGAGPHTADKITEAITKTVVPGASSREIYTRAFTMLRKEARPVAARYALRRALMEFGPTGHPFEDFVQRLYAKEGWKVDARQMIRGKCVMHEVDLYASREGERLAAELKYHNDPGYKTDLKVALYVKARFEDIWQCDPKTQICPVDRGMLITNTKFTSEAVAYADCAGIELLGWNYPLGASLFERIIAARVYPITVVTSLSKSSKHLLIDRGIVTTDDIANRRDIFKELRFSPTEVGDVLAEIEALHALPSTGV
jgi:hypothetical protein